MKQCPSLCCSSRRSTAIRSPIGAMFSSRYSRGVTLIISFLLSQLELATAFIPSARLLYHHNHLESEISAMSQRADAELVERDSSTSTGSSSGSSSSFDALPEYIAREKDNSEVRLVPSSESSEYSNAIEINSLIFRPKPSYLSDADEEKEEDVYAVAIIRSTDKVDIIKLSEYLAQENNSRYKKWELAPSYLVQDLCGFQPGSIPPLGHLPKPFAVIYDTTLTTLPKDQLLLGGGGSKDYRCLIRADYLLKMASTDVSDIISTRKRFDGGILPAENFDRPKPFFPVAPPIGSGNDNDESSSPSPQQPHRPIPVTAIGRITSVRRIAKRLVFADFAPPDYQMSSSISASEQQVEYQKDMPWRSGEDGGDMYVQMIVGKTFCDRLGDEEGPEALKLLKPGRLVLMRGGANVDPRQKNGWSNSAGNWVQKRSLDVIVSSFDILSESVEVDGMLEEHRNSLGVLPWELKRRALADPASSSPRKRVKQPDSFVNSSSDEPVLTLALFDSQLQDSATDVVLIDTVDSVEVLSKAFADLSSLSASAEGDDDLLDFSVGIDCEWRPTGAYSDEIDGNPVALLQISLPALRKIFLVDTHTLLRSGLPPSEPLSSSESLISNTIATIFESLSIIKTGFHVAIDFRRLASSFPHIPAFREIQAVVDLSTLARKVHPTASRTSLGSLQRLTRLVLGFDVSKAQQCSDWEQRPLSAEQMEYAALDCALPPRLLDEMAEGAGRAKMQSILPQLMSSWRFMTMDSENQAAITLLKAKRVVGSTFVVSQSWMTGKTAPTAPALPEEGGGPYIDKSCIKRMPSHLVKIHEGANGSGVAWDDLVGKSVGKAKGKCVELVASQSLPDGTRLDYNPRSGFVPFKDGIVLFVNMPSPNHSRRSPYPNEWLDDGRILTWYLRDKDWDAGESETAQLLGFGAAQDERKPSAVLFVRSESGVFICCGRCTAAVPDASPASDRKKNGKSLVKLHLELADWETLKESPAFVEISSHSASEVAREEETNEENIVDVATAMDSTAFQECLARMVIEGNVIDALGFALDGSKTNPMKRSIAAGVGCLKNICARSIDPDVLKAVEVLDDTAANLGLL